MHSLFSLISKLQGGIGKEPVLLSSFQFAKRSSFQRRLNSCRWSAPAAACELVEGAWAKGHYGHRCASRLFCVQIPLLCRSPKRCKGTQLQKALQLENLQQFMLLWTLPNPLEQWRWEGVFWKQRVNFYSGAKGEWAEKRWRGGSNFISIVVIQCICSWWESSFSHTP